MCFTGKRADLKHYVQCGSLSSVDLQSAFGKSSEVQGSCTLLPHASEGLSGPSSKHFWFSGNLRMQGLIVAFSICGGSIPGTPVDAEADQFSNTNSA